MSNEINLRSAYVLCGEGGEVFVKSVTTDGKTHTYNGNLADLPKLDEVISRMKSAGYEATNLKDIAARAHNGTQVFFKPVASDNPNRDHLIELAKKPGAPDANKPRRRISL